MSDDDLIRDAVHELVGAAPAPKPLPDDDARPDRSYRWVAVAAAAILLLGGITAIAWTRSGDTDPDAVATTPPPVATTVVPTETTEIPATTAPVSALPTSSTPPSEPTTTSTTSTTTSSTTSTTLAPATPEEANLLAYLGALAEGRYADAAVLLNDGALEPERRSDLRPLFDEFGDVDDLAARLESWCEQAMCTPPDTALSDIGGYWVAGWDTPGGVVISYFRSGSFEGVPNVRGLPPRRLPAGDVAICPTSHVTAVREADVDGDGTPELIVVAGPDGAARRFASACNSTSSIPPVEIPSEGPVVLGVLQPAGDPGATLLIGTAGEASVCGATYRMAQSAGALVEAGWNGCWGVGTGESIGCRDVDGQPQIVWYRYGFLGGDRLDNSTGMNVEVLSFAAETIETFTLTFPDQIEDGLRIVEPHCNGLPVITEG